MKPKTVKRQSLLNRTETGRRLSRKERAPNILEMIEEKMPLLSPPIGTNSVDADDKLRAEMPKGRRIRLVDNHPAKKPESRARLAQIALRNAASERALECNGGANSAIHRAEAERLEAFAVAAMTPADRPVVKSGEVFQAAGGYGPKKEFADTLSNPTQAAIEASVARGDLLLAANADIVAMGVDAAASARAENAFEKMLSHQLALIHALTMRTGARALEIEKRHSVDGDDLNQAESLELSRLSQTTGRLCATFQDGVLALQRLRNGGSQTMTIRHVTVESGAQAIIGNLEGGGPSGGNQGRRGRK